MAATAICIKTVVLTTITTILVKVMMALANAINHHLIRQEAIAVTNIVTAHIKVKVLVDLHTVGETEEVEGVVDAHLVPVLLGLVFQRSQQRPLP